MKKNEVKKQVKQPKTVEKKVKVEESQLDKKEAFDFNVIINKLKDRDFLLIIAAVVLVLLIIFSLISATNNSSNTAVVENNGEKTEEVINLKEENLIDTKYLSANNTKLKIINNEGLLYADIELIQDDNTRYHWTMHLELVQNKIFFNDCDYTITYDYKGEHENEVPVYKLKSGYFTAVDENTILWDGCPESGLRDYQFIKQ